MSDKYDNWERLVAAVIRREEFRYLCHRNSTDSDISISSSTSSSSSSHLLAPQVQSRYLSEDLEIELTKSELAMIFQIIDGDEDGEVSKVEIEAFYHRLGVERNDQELQAFLKAVDNNGDGRITLESFCGVGCHSQSRTCWTEMESREIFDSFDINHDGIITAEELLRVFKLLGDVQCTLEDCREMIAGADRNGDGVICFGDFFHLMNEY